MDCTCSRLIPTWMRWYALRVILCERGPLPRLESHKRDSTTHTAAPAPTAKHTITRFFIAPPCAVPSIFAGNEWTWTTPAGLTSACSRHGIQVGGVDGHPPPTCRAVPDRG